MGNKKNLKQVKTGLEKPLSDRYIWKILLDTFIETSIITNYLESDLLGFWLSSILILLNKIYTYNDLILLRLVAF